MDDTTWRPGENQHQVGQKFLKFAMWSAAGDGTGEKQTPLISSNLSIGFVKSQRIVQVTAPHLKKGSRKAPQH